MGLGELLQTLCRFAERAWKPKSDCLHSPTHTYILQDQGVTPPSCHWGGKHSLQECREAEVSQCRLHGPGTVSGLPVKPEHRPPFQERTEPLPSSLLHGPSRLLAATLGAVMSLAELMLGPVTANLLTPGLLAVTNPTTQLLTGLPLHGIDQEQRLKEEGS